MTDLDISPYEMLMLAVYDNLFIREFNIVEKSLIINMLSQLVKGKGLLNEVCSLININQKDYKLFLRINMLDETIKQFISRGVLHIKTVESLISMDKEDALLLSDWINKLKLSYSYQLQCVDYLNDISRINKTSICSILNDTFFTELLRDEKKNIPQKAREFMDHLRVKRNPEFSKYQKLFEKTVKNLNLPVNVRVQNPQFFESKGYRMEIDFDNGKTLRNTLMEITDIKYNLEALKDPWLNESDEI